MWKLAALLALATVIVARPGCAPDQFQSTVLGQIAFKGNRSNINHDGVILVSVDFTYDFDQQQEASFIRLYQNETGYEYFKEYRNYQSGYAHLAVPDAKTCYGKLMKETSMSRRCAKPEHPWKVGKFTSGSNPVVLWSGLTNDYREFTYRMDDAKTSLPYGETYVRYYPVTHISTFRYFNTTVGIADDSVLKPPSYCENATLDTSEYYMPWEFLNLDL